MKNKVPLWFKVTYVLAVIIIFNFFLQKGVEDEVIANANTVEMRKEAYNSVPRNLADAHAIDTFMGELTGYGWDCTGCNGTVNGGPNSARQDVRNGNIYYNDDTFGKIRIVAADEKFPFGTVVRVIAPKISDNPIVAIVLDRGSAIKGHRFDLLYENEAATKVVGLQKNVKYEILRYGW